MKFFVVGIVKFEVFELWNDGSDILVFVWCLKDGYIENWNFYYL